MKITFLGQNCFLFDYKGITILTDPFYNMQKEISGFDITAQKIDYVLVTHAHGDHIADVKEVLQIHPNTVLIAQPEICGYFKHENNVDLNIGGTFHLDFLKVSMVNASHTSSFPDGSYGGNPAGYMLQCENLTLYFSGDTGVNAEMEFYPKIFGEIHLAILPIGGHYTMDANGASFAASELLKTRKVIGCHFDTFPPIAINHNEAISTFSKRNVELIMPKIGEEFNV